MLIRLGYEIVFQCPQPTPMVLHLNVDQARVRDLTKPDLIVTEPPIPLAQYPDSFGNQCTRLLAPAGRLKITADTIIRDSGLPEPAFPDARQVPIQELPPETLMYLLPSRYCESDLLSQTAWQLFGQVPEGWARVQAVCDWVHNSIQFGYQYARPTKTALETFNERQGVCRDYAHLAIAMLRALNIPARYCTTYLGDIGVPPVDAPMDFAGCLEAYVGDAWHFFDPRNGARRIGRVLIAHGRDAADVAISTSYGSAFLESFKVWTEEVPEAQATETLYAVAA
ncbi:MULTISPECIES: transglutaminase-like domain-containing protein [Hydrocarboniphaga]|jgi:transglutaminase-like putative cysteine protease|uniref:Transglutaminase-like enzyme, putative cysteine protease n=1 Tax=Hydrocarboniphaga effusa AP103 TaxID=1172194 RepID=I8I1U9_9GAMM|nr:MULTISPECIES: transglutaminase family protein [Hydrocarboniphaga]EIT69761.1 transglutaminase-like enzyme, putative cysteine protease [Hydrocarboniphaga effusa AP103]MDZ4078857.1 transglutaminase family protein [Hydrocarboniphaga sp.]